MIIAIQNITMTTPFQTLTMTTYLLTLTMITPLKNLTGTSHITSYSLQNELSSQNLTIIDCKLDTLHIAQELHLTPLSMFIYDSLGIGKLIAFSLAYITISE